MRHKRLIMNAVLLLGLGLAGLHAQESKNAAGGDASGTGGSATFSVGQVVYQTSTGTSGSVTEGVQQPYEIFAITGINGTKEKTLSISAYPNPTANNLILSIDKIEISNLSYQLYSFNGELLLDKKIESTKTTIDLSNFVSASYFIKVIQDSNEIKTFKIIKK